MKYIIEYDSDLMDAESLNSYCKENNCELVTIIKDPFEMYAHYFRLINTN